MKFMFVCGGTAGHINPAISIAQKLGEMCPGSEFLFVGSGREMEGRLIPAAGYELRNITITGIKRGFKPDDIKKNIKTLENLAISAGESKKIIKDFKPDAVIGTGGYVCYPVLSQAAKLKIPTLMHEANAEPGLTTKMLSGKVDKVMTAFPDTSHHYKDASRVVVMSTPVRGDFSQMTKIEARRELGIDSRPLIVSVWGSLGASHMNELMADFIKLNEESGKFNIIHSTGGGDAGLTKMKKLLADRGVENTTADVRAYINDMGKVMTAADLVLCRAGASTIAELTVKGMPSVIVPSPYVTNNHQEKNAAAMERAGAAKMIKEPECTGEALYNAAQEILEDPARLSDMSKNALALSDAEAAEKIAKLVLSLINSKNR